MELDRNKKAAEAAQWNDEATSFRQLAGPTVGTILSVPPIISPGNKASQFRFVLGSNCCQEGGSPLARYLQLIFRR
jgi:hypothetical protein